MRDTEDREAELEALERELSSHRPYIHGPDEVQAGDGAVCFLNPARLCGPDCKAFDPSVVPPQGPEQCLILGSLLDLAQLIAKPSTEKADRIRQQMNSIPIPKAR